MYCYVVQSPEEISKIPLVTFPKYPWATKWHTGHNEIFQAGGQNGGPKQMMAVKTQKIQYHVLYSCYIVVFGIKVKVFWYANSLSMTCSYLHGIISKWRTRWRSKYAGCQIMCYIPARLYCCVWYRNLRFLVC